MRLVRTGPAAGLAALLALVAPARAAAHLRTGTVAVAYRAAIASPAPSRAAAFSVGIYASDLALHLSVRPRHTVVLRGYLGEPVARIGPAGVAVNLGSPTAAAVGLLGTSKRQGPARGWRLEPGRSTIVWHDARVSRILPGAQSSTWRIPLLVDGRPSAITGRTWRLPSPPLWPWLVLLALFAAAGLLAWRQRTQARLARAAMLLGALAGGCGVVSAAGFALGAYASPGSWIIAVDEAVLVLAGAAALAWAPHPGRVGAGLGLGALGLAAGLVDGAIFFRAEVLSVLPATLSRFFAATALGAGTVSALLATAWFSAREPGSGQP